MVELGVFGQALSKPWNIKKIDFGETSQCKGHDYITLFVDMKERNGLFVAKGKDSKTIDDFSKVLVEQGGKNENITDVSIDMSLAFINGVRENFQTMYSVPSEETFIKLLKECFFGQLIQS